MGKKFFDSLCNLFIVLDPILSAIIFIFGYVFFPRPWNVIITCIFLVRFACYMFWLFEPTKEQIKSRDYSMVHHDTKRRRR